VNFVQGCEYILTTNTHSRVSLAFRHGIVTSDANVSGFFKRLSKIPADSSDRTRCHFVINGISTEVIVRNLELVTVFPDRIMNDQEAGKMFSMFDAYLSIPINPPYFSYQEIAEWREKFIEGGGRINKDDLRRAAKLKGLPLPLLDPYEQLGISSNFFDDVRSLREIVRNLLNQNEAEKLDFSAHIDVAKIKDETDKIANLALSPLTRTWEEIPENIDQFKKELIVDIAQWNKELYFENVESAREDLYTKQNDSALKLLKLSYPEKSDILDNTNKLIYFATYGFPKRFTRNQAGITNTHNPIYHLNDCTILCVVPNKENNGWSKVFYEYEGEGYLLATKFLNIINSYKVGSRGIWWVEVNKNLVCLHASQY